MNRVKVWDLFVRLFHWTLAALVLLSFLTSEKDALVPLHARIGLSILGLVLARIVWGFLGPPHARFRDFVRRPAAVLAYVRDVARGRATLHLSHNPVGGAMVLALLAVLLALILTGAATYAGPEFGGVLAPFVSRQVAHAIKEVHEGLSGVLVGMIGAHVAGVVLSSVLERQNLVKGIITGWKRSPGCATRESTQAVLDHPIARAVASAAIGVAAALGLAALLARPSGAHAASPVTSELVREYGSLAKSENHAFQGFSRAEGRRIYTAEFDRDGQRMSCATCHTQDPRGRGRTPIGKIVEPLSPEANPERFTDRRHVEKWFKRNCNQVMGRECTAEEKGHFLTYLLGP